MEQARGFSSLAQQNLLRIFVGLAPEDAPESQHAICVGRCAAPFDGVSRWMQLDSAKARGKPENEGSFALIVRLE